MTRNSKNYHEDLYGRTPRIPIEFPNGRILSYRRCSDGSLRHSRKPYKPSNVEAELIEEES